MKFDVGTKTAYNFKFLARRNMTYDLGVFTCYYSLFDGPNQVEFTTCASLGQYISGLVTKSFIQLV